MDSVAEAVKSVVHERPHPVQVDVDRLEDLGRQLLEALGQDPEEPGLRRTPERWARWWAEFVGHQDNSGATSFPAEYRVDQLVMVGPVRVWSLCEHHLLPFWCDLHVGYITKDRILGLSKFARLAHQVAHQLQVQERLVAQLADAMQHATGSPDVAVLARGEHLCMSMRGVRTPSITTTSVMRGSFRESQARQEFLHLCGPSPSVR